MTNTEIIAEIQAKKAQKAAQKPKLVAELLKEIQQWQQTQIWPSEEAKAYHQFLKNK